MSAYNRSEPIRGGIMLHNDAAGLSVHLVWGLPPEDHESEPLLAALSDAFNARARLAAWEPVVKAAVEAVEAWEHQNESHTASMAAGYCNSALSDIVSALPPEHRP